MRTHILSLSLVGVVLGAAWGCGGDSVTDCISTRTCSYSEEGGTASDGGLDGDSAVVVPPGCDLTKDAKDAPACVDNGVGIFVAPTGSDSASGSKALPVKTIAKGVDLAASRGLPRVYVCEGTYDATLDIKNAVSIYGGLTCAWEYTGAKPKIAPPTGVALRVTKVPAPIVIQDLEIVGTADLNKPGDSAIAAFVSESMNVTFRGATLRAGPGTAGAKGASRSNYTGTATAGGLTNTSAAGTGPSCSCMDAATSSKGGAGANGMGLGVENGSATPAVGSANSGSTAASSCNPGTAGANGMANGAGTASAKPGTLSANGWDASGTAQNAANGNPGQGGGGGGARSDLNLGGGGGGCGGCGGAGGGAGTNGGSSFALVSFNSTVTIGGGTLITDAGGAGGEGGAGQPGQGGGAFGAGVCNGGVGGNGAGGSGGGGGAGGHSVPVGFVGTEPQVMGATVTPGTKGAGGAAGTPGASPGNPGAAGTAGAEGKAQNTLQL